MTSTPSGPTGTTRTCAACGATTAGNFCSECGAPGPAATRRCGGCQAQLSASAKFCHRCGLPAGAVVPPTPLSVEPRGFSAALPWAVAAIALVALVALVAGQRIKGPPSPSGAAPPLAADGSVAGGGRAPDISNMSPAEQKLRLYDRVMALAEAGKSDSVALFAPMAIAAYQQLGPLDLDGRYDLGRLGEVSGDLELAAAQADTILAAAPDHLLGLMLAASVARARGDDAAAGRYTTRFAAAVPAERRKRLAEYLTHEREINAALEQARRD